MQRGKIVALLAACVACTACAACAACNGEQRPPNVVIIGVDTLRADRLSLHGHDRATSPRLDAFAADALVFDRAITPVPRTTPAIASLMTGRYPQNTGVRNLTNDVPADVPTLAQVLESHGYQTISVTATGILYDKVLAGFERVTQQTGERRADWLADTAIDHLATAEPPFLLFAFFRDPHMEYAPPERLYDLEYDGPFRDAISYLDSKGRTVFYNPMSERTREHARALYDAEIHFADRHVGRLIDAVLEKDPNTLVVFTSDHGEALCERGVCFDHGDLLDQPALHVPLVIRGPGFEPGRVAAAVSLVDVMPTLLARLGIDPTPYAFDGSNLRRVANDPASAAPVFAETGRPMLDEAIRSGTSLATTIEARKRAIVSGDRKLVYVPRRHGPVYRYYDLAKDPGERTDLARTVPASDYDDLRQRLDAYVAADLAAGRSSPRAPSAAETERLRALGYLER